MTADDALRQPDGGAQRYHLTLAAGDRPMMHGWWASQKTAREKFTIWVGERGGIPGVRVTLADTSTGRELASWPTGD